MEDRLLLVFTVAIVLAGVGGGIWVVHQPDMANASPQIDQNPYNLTLVIQHGIIFNSSVGTQPSYFILQNGTLQSSSNLNLPADRVINLIIIDFDNGPSPLMNPNMNTVQGTIGGHVNVTGISQIQSIPDLNHEMTQAQFVSYYNNNDSRALSTLYSQVNSASFFSNSTSVSSLSANNIAHTFTVGGLDGIGQDLNIPVGHGVEFTQFYANNTGKYMWMCHVPCGPAAMSTMGWMMGNFYVS